MRSAAANGVLEHGLLPDPEGQEISDLKERMAHLERQMKALQDEMSGKPTSGAA
jgi:hypothetical protein